MFRRTITFAAVLGLAIALAPAAQAEFLIDINDPLVPDELGVDDEFQLAFISFCSGTQGGNPWSLDAGTEGDINAYNNWVQAVADSDDSLVKDRGITWKAIVSTTGKAARDNAVLGASTPLYDFNGGKIADNFADLWKGSLQKAIDVTNKGESNNQEVLTGSNWDGNKMGGGLELGTGGNMQRGRAEFFDSQWMVHNTNGDINSKYYAMSEDTLRVTPEPATMGLLVLGGLGMLIGRRRQRA